MLTFAEYCLQRDFEVDLWWDKQEIIDQATQRFHLNLKKLQLYSEMHSWLRADASYFNKFQRLFSQLKYDLIFWLSDGSIPLLHAKRNWIHFQVPFQIKGTGIASQYKLSKISQVLCNSAFTKKYIDRSFNINSDILYPPVDVHQFMISPVEKEHIILSVGRFDQIMNAKRQDVLIEAFKKMCDQGLETWKLVLAGGLQHNQNQLLQLEELAMNYPIEIRPNLGWEELLSLYKRATIYWHAAGYEIDGDKEPGKVEHFGMSVVEAMAAACIPIVYAAGGVSEIITDKEDGYFWKSIDQLTQMSLNMINTLAKEDDLILKAQKRAMDFSKEKFFMKVESLL